MRIAVVGAGGVGGYFGARLAAAGHDVGFLVRGAQLAALRSNGIRIHSPRGDLHLENVRVSDDPVATRCTRGRPVRGEGLRHRRRVAGAGAADR